jgi:hypothetical protein
MPDFPLILRAAIGLSCAGVVSGASSHDLTPTVQTASTIALVQKCQDDQPQVARDVEASFKNWVARNSRSVDAFRIHGEGINREELRPIREAFDEGGTFTSANCRDLAKALVGGQMDVAANDSLRVEPEVQAVVVIVLVQRCKDNLPQVANDIDVSFAKWETRNQKYVAELHRDGEDRYKLGLQAFRKSYDEGGRATEASCRDLVKRLQGAEMDVTE